MKKTLKKGRKISALILAVVLVLSTTTNVFASWIDYNQTGVVYLDEEWIETKQCINFWSNGQWVKNVAGQNHTLWINSIPVLYNLYDTCYWCFDKYGNIFAIDTSRRLLVCRNGSTTFQVNSVVTGCTGFQRDSGKVGYLVYTDNGSYNLNDVLNNNYSNVNMGQNSNSNIYVTDSKYPYVEKPVNSFFYHSNSNTKHNYYLSDYKLYYLGDNNKSESSVIETGVERITFTKGYVVYATTNGKVYALPIGKTNTSYRIDLGVDFDYFIEYNYMCTGYYNIYGEFKPISDIKYNNNYRDDSYSDDYYDNDYYKAYPYVQNSGTNYFYHSSSNVYHRYIFSNSTLTYKGTNNTSRSVKLASNVKRITFDTQRGYIVFADKNDIVWAFKIGNTSSIKYVGKYYDSFDGNNYTSRGYYKTSEEYYKEFSYRNYNEDEFPKVEVSGSYIYYRLSNTRYHKYQLSGTILYYKGTQSSSSSTRLATDIEDIQDITFSDEDNGYIVFANDEDKVYAYPIGKTTSSYEEYLGRNYGYFDDEDFSFSEGYYDSDNDFIDFDF